MENHNKQDAHKPKNIWGGCFTVFLFITNLVLLLFFLNMQIDLNYANGRFDAARDTISDKNNEIESLENEIDKAKSRIASLNSDNEELESKIDSLESEIDSLNDKISSANTVKISRIDIKNEHCANTFIFVDGRLAAGTRASGNTYFYLPYGSYSFQACAEPSRSGCGSSVPVNAGTPVFTFTIYRHPSCP